MVIDNVPLINVTQRQLISEIINNEFSIIENNINQMLTYPEGAFALDFDYHNTFKSHHNNIVYTHEKIPMMSVFDFSIKNTIKICKILGLYAFKPILNCIRVYENTVVPMHRDLNRGNIGRENPIYSIVIDGEDSVIFMSNKLDGSRLIALPSYTQFVMFPTLIEHGAKTGKNKLDVLQIQLDNL